MTLLVLFGSQCGHVMTEEGWCSVGTCSNGVLAARMVLVPTALPLAGLLVLAAWRHGSGRSITLAVLALLAMVAYGLAWLEHFEDVAKLAQCCPPD